MKYNALYHVIYRTCNGIFCSRNSFQRLQATVTFFASSIASLSMLYAQLNISTWRIRWGLEGTEMVIDLWQGICWIDYKTSLSVSRQKSEYKQSWRLIRCYYSLSEASFLVASPKWLQVSEIVALCENTIKASFSFLKHQCVKSCRQCCTVQRKL